MNRIVISSAALWFAAVSYSVVHGQQQPQQPPAQPAPPAAGASSRTVLDGIYTEEQAKRGEQLYGSSCAHCHGGALEGHDQSPALTGDQFLGTWNTLTVGALFERVRTTMPQDDLGKLSRAQNIDVVAYILKSNRYPAGKTELKEDLEPLNQIKIELPKQ